MERRPPSNASTNKIRLTSRVLDFDSHQKWVIGDTKLGSGSFSKVYLGHKKDDKQCVVAIKVIRKKKLQLDDEQQDLHLSQIANNKLVDSLNVEVKFLKAVNHANIIRLFDVLQSSTRLFLVYEYCDMDLKHYINQSRHTTAHGLSGLSEWEVRVILRQLTNGLRYLRSRHLVHRDLKPQNILLQKRNTDSCLASSSSSDASAALDFTDDVQFPYVLKIADFGFVRGLRAADLAETLCGTPKYMAPEILSGSKYDSKADLWSVGVILFEMITGMNPFEHEKACDFHRKHQHLYNKQGSEIIGRLISSFWHSSFPNSALDLIRRLMQPDPRKRIDWSEFFAHPFLVSEENNKSLTSTPPPLSSSPVSLPLSPVPSSRTLSNLPARLPDSPNPVPEQRRALPSDNQTTSPTVIPAVQGQFRIAPSDDENELGDNEDFTILQSENVVWEHVDSSARADTATLEHQITNPGCYELQVINESTWDVWLNRISVRVVLDTNNIQQQHDQGDNTEPADSVCADSSTLVDTLRANTCFFNDFELSSDQVPCRLQLFLAGGLIRSSYRVKLLASPTAQPTTSTTTVEEKESHFV